MHNVEARTKRFFEDSSLPKTAVFAVKFERVGGGDVFEHYANLYFWKKLRPKVGPILGPLGRMKIKSKNWSISLVKKNQHDQLTIVSYSGLTAPEAESIKAFVAANIGSHVDALKGRGKPRVLPRDENGSVVKPAKPKAVKKEQAKKPAKPVKPATAVIRDTKPKVEDVSVDFDGPSQKHEPEAPQMFKSSGAVELYILKTFERPASSLSDSAWSIFWGSNKNKLPQDFLDKYKEQLDRAKGRGIGVYATALQVIARRVGLEVLDYKQILVDKYRCNPGALGEVKMVNGLLNVEGSVYLDDKKLTKLPFKFGKVGGDFWCGYNDLTSLEGAPLEVGLSFHCSDNKLTSLEGAPLEVGGNFYCGNNRLTSLKGAPTKVNGDFWCGHNRLTSLDGAPLKVGGSFECSLNELTSLKGAPLEVGGNFYCRGNKLPDGVKEPEGVKGRFIYE